MKTIMTDSPEVTLSTLDDLYSPIKEFLVRWEKFLKEPIEGHETENAI